MSHPLVVGDYVRRTAAVKRVVERCKKVRECPYCQALIGLVKKVGSMKIIHEKFKEKDKSERAEAVLAEIDLGRARVRQGAGYAVRNDHGDTYEI